MRIIVNGKPHDVASSTLAALLAELDYGDTTVGTALNHAFVRAVDRETTALAPDDEIEIVSPRQGG